MGRGSVIHLCPPLGRGPTAPCGRAVLFALVWVQENAEGLAEAAEAVLLASRTLIGVAARCLPEAADVTLPQYRALILLAAHGEVKVNRFAELLGVDLSTASGFVTGWCERSSSTASWPATAGARCA